MWLKASPSLSLSPSFGGFRILHITFEFNNQRIQSDKSTTSLIDDDATTFAHKYTHNKEDVKKKQQSPFHLRRSTFAVVGFLVQFHVTRHISTLYFNESLEVLHHQKSFGFRSLALLFRHSVRAILYHHSCSCSYTTTCYSVWIRPNNNLWTLIAF